MNKFYGQGKRAFEDFKCPFMLYAPPDFAGHAE